MVHFVLLLLWCSPGGGGLHIAAYAALAAAAAEWRDDSASWTCLWMGSAWVLLLQQQL
jgi:hypothetical protein